MNKLLDYQKIHVESLQASMEKHNRALDCSDTGTGKTYTSIALCIEMGLKPLVICPTSVIKNWINVLNFFGAKYYGVSNYESMHNCKYYTAKSPNDKIKCRFVRRIKVDNNNKDDDDFKTADAEIFSNREVAQFTYMWKEPPKDFVLIFDEAHRCKNKKTLNSILLYTAAINADIKILMLSATIADKPEKFAIAGYVLGLYPKIRNAANWIRKVDEPYNHDMMGVHSVIFNEYASRMKIKELGILFPDNKIVANCYDMDNAEEIQQQYKIIEEEVERLKFREENSGCALSRILYARMKIEQLKIPTIIKLAKQYISENLSVAIFVNFSMTLQTIAEALNTLCIICGDQNLSDRDKHIKNFNTNKSRIIICNIKSGGVGISLHDTIGKYPRVSLISPSDSAQDIIQVLGRIHRANGKTPVSQYILYCKGTVEEKICENMKGKIQNISSLNDGIIDTYQIDGLIDNCHHDDNGNEDEDIDEIDKIINRIGALNAKKERLLVDLVNIDKEVHELELTLNAICN